MYFFQCIEQVFIPSDSIYAQYILSYIFFLYVADLFNFSCGFFFF